MDYKPRIYISAPYFQHPDNQNPTYVIRENILSHLQSIGFEATEFYHSGISKDLGWDFNIASRVMNNCDGAIILALTRMVLFEKIEDGDFRPLYLPTEYAHFEGGLAVSSQIPTLIISEHGILKRGILKESGDLPMILIDMQNQNLWPDTQFLIKNPLFDGWEQKVRNRKDVFLGYCSKANKLAKNIKNYLEDNDVKVLDWATDFQIGSTILDEIVKASKRCRCGLFLFTEDDPLENVSNNPTIVPRDNVLLEAGYFLSAKGRDKTIIVREQGAKMPADLGGVIYINITNRDSWQATTETIYRTIRTKLSSGINT